MRGEIRCINDNKIILCCCTQAVVTQFRGTAEPKLRNAATRANRKTRRILLRTGVDGAAGLDSEIRQSAVHACGGDSLRPCCGARNMRAAAAACNLSQRTGVAVLAAAAVVEETVLRFGGPPSVVETTARRLHVDSRDRHRIVRPTKPPSNTDLDNATVSVERVYNIKKRKKSTTHPPTPLHRHAQHTINTFIIRTGNSRNIIHVYFVFQTPPRHRRRVGRRSSCVLFLSRIYHRQQRVNIITIVSKEKTAP